MLIQAFAHCAQAALANIGLVLAAAIDSKKQTFAGNRKAHIKEE